MTGKSFERSRRGGNRPSSRISSVSSTLTTRTKGAFLMTDFERMRERKDAAILRQYDDGDDEEGGDDDD